MEGPILLGVAGNANFLELRPSQTHGVADCLADLEYWKDELKEERRQGITSFNPPLRSPFTDQDHPLAKLVDELFKTRIRLNISR